MVPIVEAVVSELFKVYLNIPILTVIFSKRLLLFVILMEIGWKKHKFIVLCQKYDMGPINRL